MKNNLDDETIIEILKEDQENNGIKKKKNSCLLRGLIFFILLTLLFLAFIFIQQYLLDIEAEAIVRTAKTATAMSENLQEKEIRTEEASSSNSKDAFKLPTLDPVIERTATISIQLTSVAEFQLTVTQEP
jgi:hypothetical protein